jgi:hypothetical protein
MRSAYGEYFQRRGMMAQQSGSAMTGKPLIESDRVRGTTVYDSSGNNIGSIKRLMIEKISGLILDPGHLVFIDETAVTTTMQRLNGCNPRGERLVSDAPMGHWEMVTFIAGLRQTGVVAPMLIKGALNGEAFLTYIEQCLVPTLKRRDIGVVDNVPFHKAAGVEEASRLLVQASATCRRILRTLTL